MERFAEDVMKGGASARRHALAHQAKEKVQARAIAAEPCSKTSTTKVGKGTAKTTPAPRFPFMDTIVVGPGLDLGVAAIPEANAQADRFEIARRGFIQWCFEEFQIPKAKTSQNWNRWISAKCGYSLEAVEAAVELTKRRAAVAELSKLDNPLTYTENFLRKPEVMREAQRMEEDMSSNVVRGPETWRRTHPLRAGSTKLVTTAEEMGVTPGMAEIQLRNAALSEALAF